MITAKDLGNPFAPAYRQNVAVDDAYVPCDAPGRGVEVYVPAWGFLEQARAVAILDRKHAKLRAERGQYTDGPHIVALSGNRFTMVWWGSGDYKLGDHETEDAARIAAAKALLAEDPSLGEGLYP